LSVSEKVQTEMTLCVFLESGINPLFLMRWNDKNRRCLIARSKNNGHI